jgi:CRISPR/Cas system-associated exonuclease Cas4 (RecB family)
MMTIPEGFLFSQSNLQDYIECQRRFQLRYMFHQAWPAVEAEPYLENERRMAQGGRFHKIVRQFLIGVADKQIRQSILHDEVLMAWWKNFTKALTGGTLDILLENTNQHFEEITLSVPIGDFRLIAKYDLLILQPDSRFVIFDWKTSQKHPKRQWLAERIQTHVYPYVLSGAAASFLDSDQIDPGQIEMVYWFVNQPEQVEHFVYDVKSYQEDGRYLSNLTSDISRKIEPIFPLTPNIKHCLYCRYRSLCNRGVTAGDLQHLEGELETDHDEEISIDFDQIGEIEF